MSRAPRDRIAMVLAVGLLCLASCVGRAADNADDAHAAFASRVGPLVARYCHECHAGDAVEGDVDLASFGTLADMRKQIKVWQRVAEVVGDGQMPPPDSEQPSDEERRVLGDLLREFLAAEAVAHAGDPGRVVLRRLNNAEYTHTIRDLTGVDSLDPVKEFPADGGAGEGFTNTGQSLVMSPSLATKYLDAAKGISAHAVLLPDGLRFSAGDSRRDFADEALARLKQFYARYTRPLDAAAAAEQQTVKHGIKLDTGHEGFLPVEKYLLATLAERDRLAQGGDATAAVAHERGLSPRYLAMLWEALSSPAAGEPSAILDPLRARWKAAKPADAATLAEFVSRWQTALWKFNHAGGIVRRFGTSYGPASWMEAATPLVERQEFRVKLTAPKNKDQKDKDVVTLRLAAGDAGDGRDHDVVVWKNPRLVAAGRADLPLAMVRPLAAMLGTERERVGATAAECLAAVSEAMAGPEVTAVGLDTAAAALAEKHAVDPRLLAGWLSYLGVGVPETAFTKLLDKKLEKIEGWEAVSGWRGEGELRVIANSSDEQYRIPGTVHPHGVVVHPDAKQRVIVGWRSPITGAVEIRGATASVHQGCSNGQQWSVEVWRGKTRETLAGAANEGAVFGPFGPLPVRKGDVVAVVVGAREGNAGCDLTSVDLTLRAGDREWDLARDVSGDILAANPHADGQGNAGVWHFAAEPEGVAGGWTIPPGSLLARWIAAAPPERAAIAADIERLLAGDGTKLEKDSPDAQLRQVLRSATGPLLAGIKLPQDKVASADEAGEQAIAVGLDAALFGRHPQGLAVESGDLCLQAPDSITIPIPAELAEGCEFVTEGTLHPEAADGASLQLEFATNASGDAAAPAGLVPALPVVARKDSIAWKRFEKAFDEVRDLFPKALCYSRIVPVDEVVTLNLYYREDDQLRRLMLDDAEAEELDRLWDELLFIAQEPLEFEDAFEQLMGYASQDNQAAVERWTPIKPAVAAYAEAFKKRLVDVEPRHVDAVVALAGRAFRRPLAPAEESRIRTLYDTLRKKDVPHEDAIRAVIANVLVSADFLYKIEAAGPGTAAKPVSDYELATRLSYFLWSSMPDTELLAAAESGRLHDPEVLKSEVRRMLAAPASRRLAEEFGTQWLHVHGFSSLDEKNAELFPTFADLRADMEEETVRFLDDFFRNDRSILSLIDADHTFLNERLAKHYRIEGVTGDAWRRVEGVRKHSRGSILCLATTLSTQAGASRTSPILRGNWLYETILGEKLPKPPKDVPLLAETVPTGLSERQLIAMHSENAACAKCHRRIDPFGFALEEFDAIGRLRTADASGKPLDTKAVLPDGATLDGQESVRAYLLGPRLDQFVRVFCRKLLGYALGRGVQLSDQPLLDDMAARLEAADYRISVAIEAIVTSPQFLMIRGRDAADDAT